MRSPFMPKELGAFWEKIASAGDDLQARELFRFALEAAEAGTRGREVDQALAWAEEMQDRDEGSETFGNFRWYRRNEKVVDRNAVEFSMEAGGLLWLKHLDSLSEAGRERLERLMRFSIHGIRGHAVAVSYTNIWVMKTWNCIALGEGLGDADLAGEGYAMLDQWLDYTSKAGIHEYISPTYYVASMQPMELIAQHAARAAGRAKADRALRVFWTQIAANWSTTCERLAGAHSRDYDYLANGVRHVRMRERFASLRAQDGDVHVPGDETARDVEALLGVVPRVVCQRWGERREETATTYVGKAFTIGSAAAAYGPIDKCLAANVGDADTPNVSFFTDARGDGYGQRQFRLGDGHSKALHLVPFLTSVQRGSEVLLVAAPAPEGRHYHRSAPEPTCLLSHLVLPARMATWVGEAAVGDGETVDVPNGETVFGRLGDVAIGIRVVAAKASDGGEAAVKLVRDEEGQAVGAMRLTVTHSETPAAARGVVGLWIGMKEDVDDAAFARFREHFREKVDVQEAGDVLGVSVAGWEGPMRVKVDVGKEEVIAREGGEAEEGALMRVNGRDVWRGILEA